MRIIPQEHDTTLLRQMVLLGLSLLKKKSSPLLLTTIHSG